MHKAPTMAAMPHSGNIAAVYAGVDWVSCSLSADCSYRWEWALECKNVIREIAEEGYDYETRALMGYSGYSAGGSFCGDRDDGSYLQLSGYHAGVFLDRIHRGELHYSRLDIQATVRYRTMPKNLGERAKTQAFDANAAIPEARRRKIWYMAGQDGGYTLYIGSASSHNRSRLYNKAIQSSKPEYERCWRWEVMTRNEYSEYWKEVIIPRKEDRAWLCASIVANWYRLRGVEVSWWGVPNVEIETLQKEKPSDADKRLRWLAEQVRPAVHWLMLRGHARGVYEALGLTSDDTAPSVPIQAEGGGQSDA